MDIHTEKYQLLAATANAMEESHDCSVKALAVVGDLSYYDAHCLFETLGRKKGRATPGYQTHQALEFLGLEIDDQTELWRDLLGGRTVRTLARAMKGVKGKWLVCTSHHLFAVEDGEVHDWTNGRLHRIQTVLEVTRSTE